MMTGCSFINSNSNQKNQNFDQQKITSANQVKITDEKYQQIKTGMNVKQVQDIMGAKGSKSEILLDNSRFISYTWMDSQTNELISINVRHGKVISKSRL